MAGKPVVAFSFSKKAEPKRTVAALTRKADDGRQTISGLCDGQVTVDNPAQATSLLTIPCKNPLEQRQPKRPKAAGAPKPAEPENPRADRAPGEGLAWQNMSALSTEDAEAARELLKDLSSDSTGATTAGAVAPILAREGTRRAREGAAPEATKEMFESVPVEAFGEALLRGMGYDPQKHTTKPVYHDKPRDSLLGLGAKALLPHEKAPKARGAKAVAKAAAEAKVEADAKAEAKAEADVKAGAEPKVEAQAGARTAPEAAAGSSPAPDEEAWPSRGLVVRVIGGEARLRTVYGAEAVVLEADGSAGTCRIKARASGETHVLEGVPVQSLETRVSRDCKAVKVVRGPDRGAVAKLLHRDTARGVARVQLHQRVCELPLDVVCQFVA